MKIKFEKESIIPLFLFFLIFIVWIFFVKIYNLWYQQIFFSVLAILYLLILSHEIPKSKPHQSKMEGD